MHQGTQRQAVRKHCCCISKNAHNSGLGKNCPLSHIAGHCSSLSAFCIESREAKSIQKPAEVMSRAVCQNCVLKSKRRIKGNGHCGFPYWKRSVLKKDEQHGGSAQGQSHLRIRCGNWSGGCLCLILLSLQVYSIWLWTSLQKPSPGVESLLVY